MATQPKSASHIAASLLARAHSPDTAETLLREKVKQRPLLLRPTSPDPTLNARAKRQYERHQKAKAQRKTNKPRPLSAAQKRKLSLYDIPPQQRKYSIYEPVHAMWCAYMREILGLSEGKKSHVDAQSAGPVLVSADYHGALLEIVRSRCPSRVGLKGIVVKDTKFTFELITKGDALKTVPKEYTVFRFEVLLEETQESESRRPMVFEIHGNQFETRAPDRANKKFRWHFDPDL
ncbi:Rof/RNase P-like protein [Neohortaea acidophila]|uniref:Ribonuclease P protein subunit n=1 Tax=Neohortaea acidophila TaxID=245834 RepID=A0A6A6PM86_9PEZI|nr:Rof/RNase P-like protein [Neohortaea acidophila]KAF2481025.1 Rof/RNase P-like protein [Neohortaea acidophila]